MPKNNYDDKLFDALLKIAATEALEQEMEEMPSCEELDEQYKPSPNLDKKIRKKIAQHRFKEKGSIWRKLAVKIAASAAIVMVFSSVVLLSVEATRNYIFNVAIKWQENHFSIQHDYASNLLNGIIYRPTYLPEDFIEVSSNAIGDIIRITYENENSITIMFKQSPSQTSHILADHEDKTYSDIRINGQKVYLFNATEYDKDNAVLWESNGIIFNITSEVASNELILMAESIKE